MSRVRPTSKSGRFFWKLFIGTAALVAIVVSASISLILKEFGRIHQGEVFENLLTQARLINRIVTREASADAGVDYQTLAQELGGGGERGVRVTLIDAEGGVLGDSQAEPAGLDSHANRPEVLEALAQGVGQRTRWSHTLSREMVYSAVRTDEGPSPVAVVRVAVPAEAVRAIPQAARTVGWWIAVIAIVAALALAWGLARLWSTPIRRITLTARSLSRGHLSARAHVGSFTDELADVAQSLNDLRDHQAAQLETIDRQRRTLEVLMRQLGEGVIVASKTGRIILINEAGRRLLELPQPKPPYAPHFAGMSVEQCVRQLDLQRMLLELKVRGAAVRSADANTGGAATAPPVVEKRVELARAAGPLSILAHVSEIQLPPETPGVEGNGVARLMVLTDITELTRTVQVKADFVANASHELRTPLSAMRAAIETISEADPERDAATVRRCIGIVERHASRLEELVADLLDLSKLEAPGARFEPRTLSLRETIRDLTQRFESRAASVNVAWKTSVTRVEDDFRANPYLLRLVLDNLSDNAIKFTPSGGVVTVCVERDAEAVTFTVQDTGCGIPAAFHQRVFERFFQVERSRTGTGSSQPVRRGTGLGLSIVRHAVLGLKGKIKLQSEPGDGTRVTVRIPQTAE
ncbi:MAG: HAMP domain-containing protein [Phycisphaerales bacterium]|nr:MAG: HAMP domain-containing protein [Phycisphaerales bacterium]